MIILVILDGLCCKYLKTMKFSTFNQLFKKGAWTLNAKVNYPSVTEPSISSLLHGIDATYLEVYYDDNFDYLNTFQDYPKHIQSIFEALLPYRSIVIGTWTGLSTHLADPSYYMNATYQAKTID